jgi:hypothetical protein
MFGREKIYSFTLCVLLVASVALNCVQARKISATRDDSMPGLRSGALVPPLEAKDLAGKDTTLRFDGGLPVVIYVFKPSCIWCQRNEQSIDALAAQAGPHYRFVGVSLTRNGLGPYLARHSFAFPVVTDVTDIAKGAYQLSETPETLVVSPRGRVLNIWRGAFVDPNKKEIERFFSVRLPLQSLAPRHGTGT